MKHLFAFILILLSFTNPTFACCGIDNAWMVNGDFGLTLYRDLPNDTGQTNATGRLSLGHVLLRQDFFQWGLEAGIQNGNTMRFSFPQDSIDFLGGIPVEVQLKPMLDLLLNVKTETFESIPLFTWAKGGLVYQQLHIDRNFIKGVKKIAPEFLAGIGYELNEHAAIRLGYQYIGGSKPQLSINSDLETGVIRNIPARQAVLLGFSLNF